MRRILISVLFIVLSVGVFAQSRQIEIRSSELIKGFQTSGFTRIIRPVFAHEGSTLASDSADFNQSANTFQAFGHVVITQPSGTTIYSDLLNYDGNTKLAVLTNNVRMVDGDATLSTEYLTYDMTTRIGTYTGGGKIVNGKNVLTSKNGYYFANSRDSYFRHDVVLNTPDALIKNDTLRYNSNSKIAYFYGPTHIYGKDDTLYTENGTYDTNLERARFGKNNLYTQGSKSLTGDSLFYDRKAGTGRAIGHITFKDTVEKALLKGGLGFYKKSDESILVTKNPYVVIISESDSAKVDSIWMTADTLFSKVVLNRDIKPYLKQEMVPDNLLAAENKDIEAVSQDTIKPGSRLVPDKVPLKPDVLEKPEKEKPVVNEKLQADKPGQPPKIPPVNQKKDRGKAGADSLLSKENLKADTASGDTAKSRIIIAYHKAKIFKSDLQAKADSMFFSYSDSTVRCFTNPMIWAQGSQLSGDTIFLQMKNKKLDNMILQQNSFIANTEDADSTNFNQIKGKLITGYFLNNKLNKMYVDGNAESIYYVKEDSTYSGLNHLISSRLKIVLNDNKLQGITAIRSIDASVTPMEQLQEEDRVLKGFIWKPRDRPKSKEEIIPVEVEDAPEKPATNKGKSTKDAGTKSTKPAGKDSKTPVKSPVSPAKAKPSDKTISKTGKN